MDRTKLPDWLDVSRETSERLATFADMVRQWTARINLVSSRTLDDLWERHVLDSAQLLALAPESGDWADFGSGGGFPGVVIAILSRERSPDRQVTLVESDQRKAAFLRKASIDLGLKTEIKVNRAETLAPLASPIASARALAPLEALLPVIHRHMAPTGRAILPKGSRAAEEVALARKTWQFDLETHSSRTDPQAQILLIENLRHV